MMGHFLTNCVEKTQYGRSKEASGFTYSSTSVSFPFIDNPLFVTDSSFSIYSSFPCTRYSRTYPKENRSWFSCHFPC